MTVFPEAISITGKPNGAYSMSWDSYLESDSWLCSALLGFERHHGYFNNWPENH